MENDQTERFSSLLNSFRKIPDFSKLKNIPKLRLSFENFVSEYSLIRDKAKKTALTIAPEFNIFNILGVTRDEVRTHSAMVAELLNPNGNHGQGSLFLDSFIRKCLEKGPENLTFKHYLNFPENDSTSVLTELHTPFGRMDIVILNPSIGFLCVIENKIDAYEQSHQLERYSQWIKTMNRDYPFNSLVFLTVMGYVAASAGNNQYISLSYNSDIYNWIETNMLNIQAPIVRSTLHQYNYIVRKL